MSAKVIPLKEPVWVARHDALWLEWNEEYWRMGFFADNDMHHMRVMDIRGFDHYDPPKNWWWV